MMRGIGAILALVGGVALAASTARAEIDGHGPDAWRVTGVAANDVLNMRMGPGTSYLVIDQLAPDARGLRQITCVPLLIPSVYHSLTEAQRVGLPQRWCLMQTGDFRKAGWVAQRFLMEDGLEEITPPATAQHGNIAQTIGDPLIEVATALVGDLYAAFEAQRSAAENPFAAPEAHRFFFADLVSALSGHGADLLYGAQDFQGAVTRIAPDPDQPMLRGMVTIHADFTNFGADNRTTFLLRADPAQSGAPVRIFRIEQEGWSFP